MILKTTENELKEIIKLYEKVTDYLEKNINYPNWKKYEYPNEDTAIDALNKNTLYHYILDNKIVASIVLNNYQPLPYKDAKWNENIDDDKVFVIHTFLVDPEYNNMGIASQMINFAENTAIDNNCKVMRLDTFSKNYPAQSLYKKYDYNFCGEILLKPERTKDTYFCYEKKLGDKIG